MTMGRPSLACRSEKIERRIFVMSKLKKKVSLGMAAFAGALSLVFGVGSPAFAGQIGESR